MQDLDGIKPARCSTEARDESAGGGKVTRPGDGGHARWPSEPEGPAFEADRRALRKAYGSTAMMGAGGTIGFVGPFSDAFGGVPCLLIGPADPAAAIHCEDESLHLGDFRKAIRAAVHLYDELSRAPLGRARRGRGVRS